jgi:hypothetical protein
MPCAVAVIRLLLLPQGVDLRGQVLHQQVGALHRGLAAVALQVTRRAAHAHLHVRHRRRRRQLGGGIVAPPLLQVLVDGAQDLLGVLAQSRLERALLVEYRAQLLL